MPRMLEADKLVTFRHCADLPENQCGYIRRGGAGVCGIGQDAVASTVAQFVENQIDRSGLWQLADITGTAACSCSVRTYRRTEKNIADILDACEKRWAPSIGSRFYSMWMKRRFACPESVDCARSWNARQMPLWCRWMRAVDVGSWSSLWNQHHRGQRFAIGDVINHKTENSYVPNLAWSPSG